MVADAESFAQAKRVAKVIVNSPLVKTAILARTLTEVGLPWLLASVKSKLLLFLRRFPFENVFVFHRILVLFFGMQLFIADNLKGDHFKMMLYFLQMFFYPALVLF